MTAVRVRFAPSPTGYLHVGGARTALFNWLFARGSGGVFILRIEDTDLQRSSREVIEAIIEGMSWLGLDWDEGPFLQSSGVASHRAAALRLLETGHAYRCFCTPEAIQSRREASAATGVDIWTYDRVCLRLAAGERERLLAAGTPSAIRFLVPDGLTRFDDRVHGETAFRNDGIEDFVLLRSDGSPTYQLSVVIDDIAMGITHIIRGDDHISNTPKQILLYQALGEAPPTFAHLPLILGEDKKRLSKRHGAVSVLEYREMGILPEAMFNFLALLGWSPGDDRQRMGREELVSAFSLDGVGRAGAVFDLTKLLWLNGQYLADREGGLLIRDLRPHLERSGLWSLELEHERRGWFLAVLALLRPRSRTLPEMAEGARPFLAEPESYEEEAARKHFAEPATASRMAKLRETLSALSTWERGPLEAATRGVAEELGVGAGKLIHPARLAITGRGASPGLFEVMELVGRGPTLSRLDRAIARLAAGA